MTLLWPDMPLESAQVNLRQTIYRLRQAISGKTDVPLIITDRQTIRINPDVEVHLDVVLPIPSRGQSHGARGDRR